MKETPPSWLRAAGAAMLVALMAFSAFAQTQTGNIFGTVMGTDGAVLPGVTVTLTGVGAPQTTVTDAQGRFRFVSLSPGGYAIRAELAGFGSAERTGVGVSIGQNADIQITINPQVAQTITVTAEAPLLDVRRTGTGATVTKVEMEQVPTGRDPWVILQQTPGVLMDRINVGGNESGQQSSYVSKGATASQSTWNVDGVNITDVGATGSSPTYYDFDSFEEMQLTTGGTDVRIQTPGVQINMVTKRGTNDLRGSGRYFMTSGDWQSDPRIPGEAQDPRHVTAVTGGNAFGYLARANEISDVTDWGFELGGPIIRDRLWLWGAHSNQQIDLTTAQQVRHLAQYPNPFRDNTTLETTNGKLNWQIFTSNSFTAAYTYGDKVKLGRNIGPNRPPETAWNQSGPTEVIKLEDTHVFGPNFYLTGLFSRVESGFNLIPDGGRGCKTFDCATEAVTPMAYLQPDFETWGGSFVAYETDRPQEQLRADASTFFNTGDWNHELKFGFGYREAPVYSHSAWPGGGYSVFYDTPGEAGATGGAYFGRDTDFEYQVNQTDLYVGDTIILGNLTLQAGLRYDLQEAEVKSGSVAANPLAPDLLPAVSFDASNVDPLEWDSISPRLGLTYAMGTNRRTLLRAAANRYVDQLGGFTAYGVSPLGYHYLYYYFTDVNGNRRIESSEIDRATGLVGFFGIDPARATTATAVRRWDNDLSAPYTDELLFGAETELFTNLVVGATVTWRQLNDFVVTKFEKTPGAGDYFTSADYTQAGSVTGTLPNGQAYSVPYYAATSTPVYSVFVNDEGYSQSYRGLELTLTRRMADRWMLRGNFSWSDWTQNLDEDAIDDPTRIRGGFGCTTCDGGTVISGSGTGSGAKGGVYINSRWAYNVTGAYQIPFIETSLGFNLTGRQGYPIPFVHRSPWIATEQVFKQVLVTEDVDEFRHPDVHNLDLRLAKDLRLSAVGLTLSVDVFNVLNANTTLQRNTRLGTAANNQTYDPVARPTQRGNQITEILSPRVFRVGARLTF